MSEARTDPSPAASAMGLRSGLPSPSGGDVVLPSPDAAASPQAAPGAQPSIRDQVKAKWIAAGATPQAAEGIAMAIDGESGFSPTKVGDNGTSFGLYQHHSDRAVRLLDFAKSQNKSPSDPLVQTDFAIKEATSGADPMATQHRDSFMKASDPNIAKAAFSGYFERPATIGAMMMTPVGGSRERMAAFDRDVSQQAERDRTEYERIANQTDPGSKERNELMAEARQRAARSREIYEDLARHPPPDKPIDALQNFGSIGTMLALLIGGLGRHHMNGALEAAGAMMQAAQANNHELFERQYKIWDHQSTTALNLSRLEGDEVRALLEDKRISENERQAKLHSFYEEHQMTFQANQLRAGLLEHVMSAEEARERAHETASYQKYMFNMMSASAELRADPSKDPAEVYAKWGIASAAGVKAGNDPKAQAAKAFQDKIQAEKGRPPDYDDWLKYSQESKGASTGQLSPEAAQGLAKQYEMGDTGVITSLPRGGPGRLQVENQVFKDLGELPGGVTGGAAEIVKNRLRMAEARSAATTAGRITMNTALYSQEAQGAGDLLIKASKDFPRTEIPRFNQALQAYERGTGDPHIIAYGTALNSLVNAYGKMTNPTGTGIHDADKESLRLILDTSLSQGQIEAGVAQIIKEGRNVSNAAQQAQVEAMAGLAPRVPGAQPSPPTTPATPAYGLPDDVYRAFDAGQLTKDQAKQILIDKFGAKAQ